MPLKTLIVAAILSMVALPAAAQCYVDYRAQRTGPVQLHYGVAEVPCNGNPAADLAQRLARHGWTLVDILSTFGPEGLASRQARAGQYFLRY